MNDDDAAENDDLPGVDLMQAFFWRICRATSAYGGVEKYVLAIGNKRRTMFRGQKR